METDNLVQLYQFGSLCGPVFPCRTLPLFSNTIYMTTYAQIYYWSMSADSLQEETQHKQQDSALHILFWLSNVEPGVSQVSAYL